MRGLAIDAHDGFSAAEADQQPATVLEPELEAVHRDEFHHFQTYNRFGVCIENDFFACFAWIGTTKLLES